MNIAIIFAGGTGQRLLENENSLPKQFIEIEKKPILIHTLLHFENHENIDKIYLSMNKDYIDLTKELIKKFNIKKVEKIVKGGFCAMDSIYNALEIAQLENPKDSIVLIHDGVRPIITKDLIDRNIEATKKFKSAISSIPCYETILVSEDGVEPTNIPLRKETFCAQAPQSFILEEIYSLHKKIREKDKNYTDIVDNCTLFYKFNKKPHLIEGLFGNIKVTTPSDIHILKGILKYQEEINAKII